MDVYQTFSLDRELPVVTVIGGSLGAQAINEMIPLLRGELGPGFQIVHQTGEGKGTGYEGDGYVQIPFLHDEYMPLLQVSLCVISRAGASALADFIAAGVPMILIPLPRSASRGDQIENGRLYHTLGCAYIVEEENPDPALIARYVRELADDSAVLSGMKEKIRWEQSSGAAETISQIIVDRSGKKMVP